MKVTSTLGRIFKPFVNFPRWMGLAQIWANGRAIVKMLKDLRVHRPPTHQESFEEAMSRLNLTEEDIKERMRHCFRLAVFYSILTLIFLSYTLYMVVHGHIGMVIGFLITVLMASFAYREHFWYFQMKTRSLGNNFRGWLSYLLRGKRK